MNKKKILFAGCSLTASSPDSGFNIENHLKYHWTNKLANYYQFNFDNIAIGGMSNSEIYYRTIERCVSQNYDLVIIMWTSMARKWVYYCDNNVDDFTGFVPSYPFGLNSNSKEVKLYFDLYYTHFQNSYIDLKHWLVNMLALSSFFKIRKQPFIFIKGFENFISDFQNIIADTNLANLNNDLKNMLDFNNRPDDYIFSKIINIKNLIIHVRDLPWLNFDSESFISQYQDKADDGLHPGPGTNEIWTNKIIEYITNKNIL